MSLSKDEIISNLRRLFPDGIIYADTYIKTAGILSVDVRKEARQSEQSSVEWLTSCGFVWKETGYIEPDMKLREAESKLEGGEAFALADYVFRKYPLAGEYILSDSEERMLYQAACKTVNKMIRGDARITGREEVVLVLETIELLKCWAPDPVYGMYGSFWQYIFLQFGFNPENSEAAGRRVYAQFRVAIKNTLTHYKRYFAPAERTHRYYTTLLLHALAPKQSIEAFFNILFDFYVKNLDFQYIAEDTSYKIFTRGMRARWDNNASYEDIHLRSEAVASGLQSLFIDRPGYMAVKADTIVKQMDAVLRGDVNELVDSENNYWDQLLMDWYQKKSAIEKVHAQGERRKRKTEYIATSIDRIYIQYAVVGDMVGFVVPAIRLPKGGNCRPVLTVAQGEEVIFNSELVVAGNDLCLTTRSRFIPLAETEFNPSKPWNLRVEITHEEDTLYDSGRKLFREAIVFDVNGAEHQPRCGTAYLFVGEESRVEFSNEDCVYQYPHLGQLYKINIDEVSSVAINGVEILASEGVAARFRHHTSERRIPGVRAVDQGKRYDVFPSAFQVTIHLPENENPKRYQIANDGDRAPLETCYHDNGDVLIESAEEDGKLHSIRIIDVVSGAVQFEFCYTVLEQTYILLDKPIYRSEIDEVSARIISGEIEHETQFRAPLPGIDVPVTMPGQMWLFEIHVPVVTCTITGESAFASPGSLWHNKIPSGAFVETSLPVGWKSQLFLGLSEVPAVKPGCFELGNCLRAKMWDEESADLWLSIARDGTEDRATFKLTEIVFAPRFEQEPLQLVGNTLIWSPENNFVGEPGTEFVLERRLKAGPPILCDVTDQNCRIDFVSLQEKGVFPYRVYVKQKSLFTAVTEELIYEGTFIVGEPEEIVFLGKEIHLGSAMCWDFDADHIKSVFVHPNAGILTRLNYVGNSIASGETVSAPSYTAEMFFETKDGRRLPFNAVASKEYELVNPVKVWIINDHLLILRCATDDAVYIDKQYASIVNRSPDCIMSKYEQAQRLETPDYFEYQVREGYKGV